MPQGHRQLLAHALGHTTSSGEHCFRDTDVGNTGCMAASSARRQATNMSQLLTTCWAGSVCIHLNGQQLLPAREVKSRVYRTHHMLRQVVMGVRDARVTPLWL